MQQRELPSLGWRRWQLMPPVLPSTAHHALCSRGWKGRHSLSSSNRGIPGGGDGGSHIVGLLVRGRCSSLHKDTSLAPCLKAGQQSNSLLVK